MCLSSISVRAGKLIPFTSVSAGTLQPAEKREKLYEWDFLHNTEKSHLLFSFGWELFIQTIGELRMKDQNEFGKNVKKVKEDSRLRLGKVTLEFGSGGSLTEENMDLFLSEIRAIDILTIKGLITDMVQNLQYIAEKMQKYGIVCGQIRAEITL